MIEYNHELEDYTLMLGLIKAKVEFNDYPRVYGLIREAAALNRSAVSLLSLDEDLAKVYHPGLAS